jgi:LuxR family transcriptional regulator, maltose regulon positive regulatory protein
MVALAVILQAGIAFSGIGVWICALAASRRDPGLLAASLLWLYTGLALAFAAEASLVAAYRLRDLQALFATDRALAAAFIEGMPILAFAGRCAALYFAASAASLLVGSARGASGAAAAGTWAAAWIGCRISAFLVPPEDLPLADAAFAAVSAAYPAILALFAARYLSASRRSRGGRSLERAVAAAALFAYLPARLGLAVADALTARGVPLLAPAWVDSAAFLALNAALFARIASGPRGLARSPSSTSGPGPRSAPALAEATFDEHCAAFGLSRREIEVASLLISRSSYKEVASELCISTDTVKSHAKSLYRKTKARNRFDLLLILGRSH